MKPKFRNLVTSLSPRSSLSLIAFTSLLAGGYAAAQSGNWSATASGPWGTATNWAASTVANGSGNLADFTAVDVPATGLTVTLDSARTIGSLSFGDTDLATVGAWTVSGANTLTLASSGTPVLSNSVNATISSVIAGTSGYSKEGSGTLTLTADNSAGLTGGITVKAGTLSLITGAANLQKAIGNSANTITFEGGTLALNGSSVNDNGSTGYGPLANPLVVASGQTGTIRSFVRGAITSALTGGGTLNLVVRATRGDISGNWGAFTGNVIVSSQLSPTFGDLRVAGTGQFANAKLHLNPSVYMVQTFNPPNGGATASTTVQNIGELSGSVGSQLAGNPVNGRWVAWTIGGLNTDSLFEGTIVNATGAARIVKVGTGTLTLTGNNTYTGNNGATAGTQVTVGTLSIGNGGASGSLGATNVAVSSGATLIFNRDATLSSEYPGVLSGAGTVIKRGAGQVNFTGVNTYTAGTSIEGGLIGINSATSLGDAAGATTFSVGNGGIRAIAPAIVSTRSFVIDGAITASFGGATAADSLEISSPISGSGALSVDGSGILYLSAENTYSGSTSVNSGTLSVTNASGSATSTGAVTIGSSATLAGTGTISGSVSVANGAKIRPGGVTSSSTSVGTLSTGSLTLAGGSTLYQEFSSVSAYDKIVVSGDIDASSASVGNPVIVDIRAANSVAKWITNGTYNIMEYSGTFTGDANDLFEVSETSKQEGLAYTFAASGGVVTLTISGLPPSQWNVDASGDWSNAANWLNGAPDSISRTAILGNVITAPRTITLDAPHTVGSMVIDNANPYTVGGTSTLTLAATTGNASISVLQGSHAVNSPISLSNSLELTFVSGTNSLSMLGDISGVGGLINSYPSTVTLGGNNTFSGAVNLSNGTLEFANNSLGSGSLALNNESLVWSAGNTQDITNRAITFGSGNVSFNTNGNNVTFANSFGGGGTGTFTKAGGGTLALLSDPDFSGSATVSGGRLKLGDGSGGGVITGDIINNSELELMYEDGATLTNLISGTGSLIHSGAGNLNLTAANTFSGTTTIPSSSAKITLLNSLNLQNSTLSYSNTGGTLSFGGLSAASLGGLNGNKDLALLNDLDPQAAVALTVGGNGATTSYSGILSGSGSLTKNGTGTLTLTGANTYSGATTINAGNLKLASGGTISTTSANVAGGLFSVEGGTLTSSATTFVSSGGAVNGFRLLSGSATFAQVQTAANNDGGLISVEGGTFTASSVVLPRTASFGTGADPTAVGFDSGFVVKGGVASVGTLQIGTINSSSAALFSGGDTTISSAVTVGNTTNTRWSVLEARGGTLTSTDAAAGIAISTNASTANRGCFLVTGATAYVEKITFGSANAASGSIGRVTVSSGTLYIGAGGVEMISANPYTTEFRLAGGTLGAKAAWSTSVPISVTGTGTSFIKAADATDLPFNITLTGPLTGTGSVEKNGLGVVTLGGGHAYSGNTTVYEGKLKVTTNTFNDISGITIYGGATLELAFAGGDKVDSLTINGDTKAPGAWGAPGSGATNTDPALEGTGILYVGVDVPVSGYDAWVTTSGLTVGVNDGPNADPDNDGIENQLEFVLGGDPLASSQSILPELDASGSNFIFTFKREDDSEAEIALTFQHGSDLAGWTDVAIDADGNEPVVTVSENLADPDDITITIPKGSSTELFGRLRGVK